MRQRVFSAWGIQVGPFASLFKPLLFWKFSNFFTFILGGQFLLPQRANNGEVNDLLQGSSYFQHIKLRCDADDAAKPRVDVTKITSALERTKVLVKDDWMMVAHGV